MKTYIDLHIHSTASDGTFSPTEIINDALKLAGDKNPVVIALTDHDTVAGTEEFQKAAAKHKRTTYCHLWCRDFYRLSRSRNSCSWL